MQDHHAVRLALEACDETDAALADVLVRFVDLPHGRAETVTFDKRSARLPGMRLLQ